MFDKFFWIVSHLKQGPKNVAEFAEAEKIKHGCFGSFLQKLKGQSILVGFSTLEKLFLPFVIEHGWDYCGHSVGVNHGSVRRYISDPSVGTDVCKDDIHNFFRKLRGTANVRVPGHCERRFASQEEHLAHYLKALFDGSSRKNEERRKASVKTILVCAHHPSQQCGEMVIYCRSSHGKATYFGVDRFL